MSRAGQRAASGTPIWPFTCILLLRMQHALILVARAGHKWAKMARKIRGEGGKTEETTE